MSESTALIRALSKAVDRRTDQLYELLARLVSEQTVLGSEEGGQQVVEEWLRRLGFAVERISPSKAHTVGDARAGHPAVSYEGRTCVAGRMEGSGGGPSLHLSGHMDVVPVEAAERWTHDPWAAEISDGRMWGRGAGDMKAGLAAYLVATEVMLEVVGQPQGDLYFSSVIEEEIGGNGMLAVLHSGYDGDATLIGEPTDLNLLHAGVGLVWARLTVHGSGAHASTADVAQSPIARLFAATTGLRELEAELNENAEDSVYATVSPRPYKLNLGEIHAGVWPSSVPVEGTLRVRLGFGLERSVEEVQDLVKAAVKRSAPEVEVSFEGFRASAYCHDLANPLVEMIDEIHGALHGEPPGRTVLTGTTDARFVAGPCVCYGPAAGNYHGTDEWVDLQSVRDTALAVAAIAARWVATTEAARVNA